ncbi:MAG: hypothetical protein ABFS21_00865 [Actinomycetota bacterium]
MLAVLRILLGVAIAVTVATALIPLIVISDLASGGSGWGLCPEGLGECSASYFTGPELFLLLVGVLFLSLGAIALCLRGIRYLESLRTGPSGAVSEPH